MTIQRTLLFMLLLGVCTFVGAQERGSAPEYLAWRTVSMDMSPAEYRQTYRENRRFLRRILKSHATASLVVLGTAAALALDKDAKLPLNQSRSLAVFFSDMSDEDRAVKLGYTLRW